MDVNGVKIEFDEVQPVAVGPAAIITVASINKSTV